MDQAGAGRIARELAAIGGVAGDDARKVVAGPLERRESPPLVGDDEVDRCDGGGRMALSKVTAHVLPGDDCSSSARRARSSATARFVWAIAWSHQVRMRAPTMRIRSK